MTLLVVFVHVQPKVGAKEEVDALLPEYEGNPKPGFRKGVQDLGKVWVEPGVQRGRCLLLKPTPPRGSSV